MKEKKVLIISRSFAPSGLVGGFRPEGWARYFPGYGIKPTIITPSQGEHHDFYRSEFPDSQVITFDYDEADELVPQNLKKRFPRVGVFYRFLSYYSNRRLKKNDFFKVASKELSANQYDLIIVTGPPYYLIKIGQLLARRFGINWIADTRDAWTTNLVSRGTENIKNSIFRYLERRVMKSASLITTASPTNVKGITSVNPGKEVMAVENGFFEQDFEGFEGMSYDESGTFRICYFGTLYQFQPIELFFGALTKLGHDLKGDFTMEFVGTGKQPNASRRIMTWDEKLSDKINITPILTRKEALLKGLRVNVLLLLADPDTPLLPTKIYDYVALQRPIIIARSDRSYIYELLHDYELAYFCETEEEILQALVDIKKNAGLFTYDFSKTKSSNFSKRYLMKNLTEYIKHLPDQH